MPYGKVLVCPQCGGRPSNKSKSSTESYTSMVLNCGRCGHHWRVAAIGHESVDPFEVFEVIRRSFGLASHDTDSDLLIMAAMESERNRILNIIERADPSKLFRVEIRREHEPGSFNIKDVPVGNLNHDYIEEATGDCRPERNVQLRPPTPSTAIQSMRSIYQEREAERDRCISGSNASVHLDAARYMNAMPTPRPEVVVRPYRAGEPITFPADLHVHVSNTPSTSITWMDEIDPTISDTASVRIPETRRFRRTSNITEPEVEF